MGANVKRLMAILAVAWCAAAAPAAGEPSLYTVQSEFTSPDPAAPARMGMPLGDRILVQLGPDELAAVQPRYNRIEWRIRPGGEIRQVLLRGSRLVVHADDLYGFEAETGIQLWIYPLTGQHVLHLGDQGALVSGFDPSPIQLASISLETGSALWPTWAMLPGAVSAELTEDRWLVRVAGQPATATPVDRRTGRVYAAIPAPDDSRAEAAGPDWRTRRRGDRVLLTAGDGAAWLEAGSVVDSLTAREGGWIVATGGKILRMSRTPLSKVTADCRAAAAEGDAQCLADLLPLAGALPGTEALGGELLDAVADELVRADSPSELGIDALERILPAVAKADPDHAKLAVARLALHAITLERRGDLSGASTLVEVLDQSPSGVFLKPLVFALALSRARALWRTGNTALARGDRQTALECVDEMVGLSGVTAVLPPEVVDAGDSHASLRAAYSAIEAALPGGVDPSGADQQLCLATCRLEHDAAPASPAAQSHYQSCLARCTTL
jgi:hypothetical protein